MKIKEELYNNILNNVTSAIRGYSFEWSFKNVLPFILENASEKRAEKIGQLYNCYVSREASKEAMKLTLKDFYNYENTEDLLNAFQDVFYTSELNDNKEIAQLIVYSMEKGAEEGAFTFQKLVSEYFNINFELPKGYAKINVLLKKAGHEATDKELSYINEALTWFMFAYLSKKSLLTIDDGYEIPYGDFDDWAFQGSCHLSCGVGRNTPEYLYDYGFEMVRIYAEGEPFSRAYIYRKGDDIAHGGSYSDFGYSQLNHTAYMFTTMLLCYVFGYEIDNFEKICGHFLKQDMEGVWSNMSDSTDYQKWGTSEILSDLVDETGEYSEHLGRYVYEDDDDIVWCNNIEDYEEYDSAYWCEQCDVTFSMNGYHVRSNDCLFCDMVCCHNYYGIEEVN